MSRGKRSWGNYLFMVPAFVIYVSVIVVPTVYSLVLSLFKWNGIAKMQFVGLRNYINLFTMDKVFRTALVNNLIWLLLSVAVMTSLALAFALVLNMKFKGRAFFRGLYYFPAILSGIVVAIIWTWIYNPQYGFINEFLRLVGWDSLTHPWLSDPNIALICVFIAYAWLGMGQPMILFLSGLQTVPEDILEAAEIDGAGKIKRFFLITCPMLKETFIIVLATLIIAALKVYDIIYGLTGGGPNNTTQTLATYMYSQTFMYNNVGMGTAIACVMLFLMLFIIVPYVSFTAKED